MRCRTSAGWARGAVSGYLALAVHNRSDQFCKNVLRDALSLASAAETEVEVLAATQKIDVYSVPDPARHAERARMGMLGELSAVPSMFEPYHDTPSFRQVRACLRKQLTWAHELERRARAATGSPSADEDPDGSAPEDVPYPTLVVISPGRPETALKAFGCVSDQAGVYDAWEGWAVRVIVLAELVRTRETLLLRLLGRGRLLRDALANLGELPVGAWERSVVMPFLVHFRLQDDGSATTEEDDVNSAEIRAWFEDYEQALVARGVDQGIKRGERAVLLRQLRARFGELPASVATRVEAADVGEIERWADRVLSAKVLDEVFREPS